MGVAANNTLEVKRTFVKACWVNPCHFFRVTQEEKEGVVTKENEDEEKYTEEVENEGGTQEGQEGHSMKEKGYGEMYV